MLKSKKKKAMKINKNLTLVEKIKNFLDQEVESRRTVLLTLLQPIVILTMGAFVMLIVLAIMLPLLQMNNLIFNI